MGLLLTVSGCKRNRQAHQQSGLSSRTIQPALPELDFPVVNRTPQTWYVTCFYWGKKIDVPVWRWYKSPIYTVHPGEEVIVDIDTFNNKKDRNDMYGWLAVFDNFLDADVSTWSMTPDESVIQLGKLSSLKEKTDTGVTEYQVTLTPEKYGFYGTIVDYEIQNRNPEKRTYQPELDFWVENNTDDFMYITVFAYQRHDRHISWVHDATDIIGLAPGDVRLIDVESIAKKYDWEHVHAHLALFKTHHDTYPKALLPQAHDTFQEDARAFNEEIEKYNEEARTAAENATYELLGPRQNIKLPRLADIRGKKIVLKKRPYGLIVDRDHDPVSYFIEYEIQDFDTGKPSIAAEKEVSSLDSFEALDKKEAEGQTVTTPPTQK